MVDQMRASGTPHEAAEPGNDVTFVGHDVQLLLEVVVANGTHGRVEFADLARLVAPWQRAESRELGNICQRGCRRGSSAHTAAQPTLKTRGSLPTSASL